ncbi:MAG: hypothetical protein ACFNYH_04100, partial [Limosilactobacillus fermentum]
LIRIMILTVMGTWDLLIRKRIINLLATLLTQVLRTVFERGEFPTPAEIRALKAAFARLLN